MVRGGPSHDVTRADVRARILSELRSAAYAAVLVATPCTSFSVARGNHEDGLEHPGLRTFEHESGPPGASETAREFVRKHDAFVDFTIDLANAAFNLDLDLAIENPAPRDDPDVASYWPARAHLPQLWDMRRASISGSVPTRHGHEEGSGQTPSPGASRAGEDGALARVRGLVAEPEAPSPTGVAADGSVALAEETYVPLVKPLAPVVEELPGTEVAEPQYEGETTPTIAQRLSRRTAHPHEEAKIKFKTDVPECLKVVRVFKSHARCCVCTPTVRPSSTSRQWAASRPCSRARTRRTTPRSSR